MATEVLVPNSTASSTGTWTGTYADLDEDVNAPSDGDYISCNYTNLNGELIFNLVNPSVVLSAGDIIARVRAIWVGSGSCTLQFAAQIGGSDLNLGSLAVNTSYQNGSITTSGTWNQTDLDGCRLRVKMTATSGTGQLRISAASVDVSDGAGSSSGIIRRRDDPFRQRRQAELAFLLED
jgi:hypothetical protein